MKIDRNVRTKERALEMIKMANELNIEASYIMSGIWYIVSFCPRSNVNWQVLEHRMIRKFLKTQTDNF